MIVGEEAELCCHMEGVSAGANDVRHSCLATDPRMDPGRCVCLCLVEVPGITLICACCSLSPEHLQQHGLLGSVICPSFCKIN